MDSMLVAAIFAVIGSLISVLLVAGGYFAGRIRVKRELDELNSAPRAKKGRSPA